VIDAVRLGAYDYLIKPCDLDVLEMSVERSLERRALLRNAHQYKLDLERSNAELRESKAKLGRLQAQIVHSEKMASLGQLAAGVAHELNNPAGFIFGNMEILKECSIGIERLLSFYEQIELPPAQRSELGQIKDEIDYENTLADLQSMITDCREGAERIRDVVQNLRIFSRLDEAEFKKVDIHEGLESTIRLLSRYYAADQVELVRHYGSLPPVDCYAGQLNQVWMNLLVNAAQAVGDGGTVQVATTALDSSVVVTISDNGCGIAPEDLSRIFDPFFTTKPVGDGTGLGLSVIYSIIERHHGSIDVQSKVGDGTTFTVTIPIDAEPDGVQPSVGKTRDEHLVYSY
jgi:signal transduction histidine kinase